jgi:magnesium-transporting ATPase (P-type)
MQTYAENEVTSPYWNQPADALMARIGSRQDGLSSAEARARQNRGATNRSKSGTKAHLFWLLARQFNSSIIWILIFAAALSYWLGEHFR